LIGANSVPIAASDIASIPPGMVASQFFGYQGSYLPSDSLYPARAYWVRVSEDGQLILTNPPSSAGKIQIIAIDELPPAPPQQDESATEQVPSAFTLMQNYPNPFNPTTSIKFTVNSSQFVTLKVYNLLGQEVATLVNEVKAPGEYVVQWQADLPSGIYIYRLQAGKFIVSKKMLLVK